RRHTRSTRDWSSDVCSSDLLGFLFGAWRDGRAGAVQMGIRHGVWCVGCCWALMASLFALGVMSVVWMAVVAGLIALEKTLPWRRSEERRVGKECRDGRVGAA